MQTAAVPPPALQLLRAFGSKPQLAQPGEVLIRAGEPAAKLLLLASGWACREQLRSDGNQVLLDLYLPGDLMGLDNLVDEEAFDSIIALTMAAYYTLQLKSLELLLLHNPGLRLHIIRKTIEERRRLEQRLDLARLNAVHRTAACLLRICERLQKHGMNLQRQDGFRFALPLAQQRLADYLGLHPMHLNRTLRALRETGIVDVGPHEVNISSVSRLKEMAGLSRSGINPPLRRLSKKSAKMP
jgi:CRP/FNR family transcriptional regulator